MTVEPIRNINDIRKIKRLLQDSPRELALFTTGINTAFRASEILSITVGQVRSLSQKSELSIKEPKTKKYRRVKVNDAVKETLTAYLESQRSHAADGDLLFVGRRGRMTTSYFRQLVKSWCRKVDIRGNFGTHTLRKTWAYHQRKTGADLAVLSRALGHSNPSLTMLYIGVQPQEVEELYDLDL